MTGVYRKVQMLLCVVAALHVVVGIAKASKKGEGNRMATMNLSSTAFKQGASIPKKHTCQGADISVPLQWTGVPEATKSLVLIVDDPDAPDPAAPKTVWVHWLLYNMPPETTSLAEGVSALPKGTREGVNDWKRTGWGGPCPPKGRHRYYFKLYALSDVLPDLGKPTKDKLLDAMKGKIIAEAEFMGTYQK